MNPKISIDVDLKNKAVATITGMATVGAKIDVEVTGLPSGIQDWGTDDKWNGESLRFRIVDIDGTDLVRFPLNEKTTSTDGDQWLVTGTGTTATHATYDGTAASPVEFDTDLLRKAFVGVPYNETLEFGIILDSIVDKAQYAVGKIKISQWASASTEDPTVLPDWREVVARIDNASATVVKPEGSDTATITITDTHGTTTTARVKDGAKGDQGETGPSGTAATIAVGTVTTGEAGTSATVTNVGTSSAAVFNFTIPRGADGGVPSGGSNGDLLVKDSTQTGGTKWATPTFAKKPTTGSLGSDSSLNDVILKINTLISELKA